MNILDALTIGMGYVLFIGILRAHFNFSSLQLGIITVFEALVAAIIQVFVGRMIEKYGCKILLFSSYLAFLIYLAGIALSKSYLPILLLQIFWGIALATWASPHQTLMANSTTQAERAEAMGRINLYKGMFGFLAPFLGGFLYEQYGYSAPLWASFICGLIVTVFIHFFIRVENDRLM
jgi:MFS family permease